MSIVFIFFQALQDLFSDEVEVFDGKAKKYGVEDFEVAFIPCIVT